MHSVTAVKTATEIRSDVHNQKIQLQNQKQQTDLIDFKQFLKELETTLHDKITDLSNSTKMDEMTRKSNTKDTKTNSYNVWKVVSATALTTMAILSAIFVIFNLWLYWPVRLPPYEARPEDTPMSEL